MVVRHVLGNRDEGGDTRLLDLLQDLQIEIGQVLIDLVDQLGLVVEGQADFRESHQRAGKPEVPFDRDPHDGLPVGLPPSPRPHRFDRLGVVGEEVGPNLEVIVHVGDDALDVVLHGLDGRIGRGEPELLVGVEPEVLGDVEYGFQLCGQPLLSSMRRSSRPTTWPIPSAAADRPAENPSRPEIVRHGSLSTYFDCWICLVSSHNQHDLAVDEQRCLASKLATHVPSREKSDRIKSDDGGGLATRGAVPIGILAGRIQVVRARRMPDGLHPNTPSAEFLNRLVRPLFGFLLLTGLVGQMIPERESGCCVSPAKSREPSNPDGSRASCLLPQPPTGKRVTPRRTGLALDQPSWPCLECAVGISITILRQLLVPDHSVRPEIDHLYLQRVIARFCDVRYVHAKRRFPKRAEFVVIECHAGHHLNVAQIKIETVAFGQHLAREPLTSSRYVAVPEKYLTPGSLCSDHDRSRSNVTTDGAPHPEAK